MGTGGPARRRQRLPDDVSVVARRSDLQLTGPGLNATVDDLSLCQGASIRWLHSIDDQSARPLAHFHLEVTIVLYVDIPSQKDIKALNTRRADACLSIYLPTTPLTQDIGASQLELKNLAKDGFGQLEAAGFDKRRLSALQEKIDDLLDDDAFWRLQANSLAVLATPDDLRTFRLANKLHASVEVADRYHLKPLLRAVAFPHTAYVLAISENSVRLVEVTADAEPKEIRVPDLPKDAASAVHKSTLNSRAPSGRIQGSEGQKVRLAQYARSVDAALRPILAGLDVPLILAASEPLASIYRSVSSFSGLLADGITTTHDRTSNGELADAIRPVLDRHYEAEVKTIREVFAQRADRGRTATDVSDVARAATLAAVDTLLVDIDAVMPGLIDETTGALVIAKTASAASYDVIDEIAGRTIAAGGRVLAVRSEDIPGGGPTAAILRYSV